MEKNELLIPAGSLKVLKTAVIYGADAVYIGGESFGLRAKAKNFSNGEMAEGIEFAHKFGKKVYVAVNILAHNDDIKGADDYFEFLRAVKPDALIISDPGLFLKAKKICPGIGIHISTQANNTNYETFNFWHSLGAKRAVCARELSLKEIKQIREKIPADMEIEAFVHGAMCISYSGRCLLSSFMAARDSNRGECTHPCRWKYYLMEEKRQGEYFPVYENERGTYIFNSKDLCMIEHLFELTNAGVYSMKVEGRMKTALYVASVARTYRKALNDLYIDKTVYERNMKYYLEEIAKCTYRDFTTGFFFGKPDEKSQIYDENTYIRNYIFLGTVDEIKEIGGETYCVIEQKNKFSTGDIIEIMKPDNRNIAVTVNDIMDEDKNHMESCPHPGMKLYVKLVPVAEKDGIIRDFCGDIIKNADKEIFVSVYDILRVKAH